MGKHLLLVILSFFTIVAPLSGSWQASVGSSSLKVVPPRLDYGPLKGGVALELAYQEEFPLLNFKGSLSLNLPLSEKLTLVWGNLEHNPLIAPLFERGFSLSPHKGGGGEPLKASYTQVGEAKNYMGGFSLVLPKVTLYGASFSEGVMVGGGWGETLAGGLLLKGRGDEFPTTFTIPYRALPIERGGVAYLNYTQGGDLKTSLLLRFAYCSVGGLGLSNLFVTEWSLPPFKVEYRRLELPPYLGAIKSLGYKTIEGPLRENVFNMGLTFTKLKIALTLTERLYERPIYADKGQRHLLSLKGVVAYSDLFSLSLLYEWRHNRSMRVSEKYELTWNQKITLWGVRLELEPILTYTKELLFSGRAVVKWEGEVEWSFTLNHNSRGTNVTLSLSKRRGNYSIKGEWQSSGSLTLSFTIFQPT